MVDSITEKISKLLAAAEGAATQKEAEAFYERAQQMASKYSVDLAVARMASQGKDKGTLEVETLHVARHGEKKKHGNKFLLQLLVEIAHQNDIRMTLAASNTYGTMYGFKEDVENTKMIWASVAPTMQRMAEEYLKTDEWREETVYRAKKKYVEYDHGRYYGAKGYWEEDWGHYPITRQAARASYYEGFIAAIGDRLRAARQSVIEEQEHFHSSSADSTLGPDPDIAENTPSVMSLVLKEKSKQVDEFFDEKYYGTSGRRRRGGSWRGYDRSGGTSHNARGAGRKAGQSVSMGARGSIGGSS